MISYYGRRIKFRRITFCGSSTALAGRIVTLLLSAALMLCCVSCKKQDAEDKSGADLKCTWSNLAINGGGFVPEIVYSRAQEGLAYARTDNGGAYRYDSENACWIPLTDFISADEKGLMSVESIAADPSEAGRVYIACGSDESEKGCIMSSSDFGETWTRFTLDTYCGGELSGMGAGERLAVDPCDSKIVYFCSRAGGLYKSTDYGATFNSVSSFPVKGSYLQEEKSIGVMWLVFDESTGKRGKTPSQVMYAGVAESDGSIIYKSSDAGASWTSLTFPEKELYPLNAAISSDGSLYITLSDNCGPGLSPTKGAVYCYDSKKDTFTDITPADSGVAHGFGGVSVDALNPQTVVVSTLGLWYPLNDNIYRSTDGGKSWSSFFSSGGEKYYRMDYSSAAWLEWNDDKFRWLTDVKINPFNSDELMFGSGATILRTTNLTKLGSGINVVVEANAKGLENSSAIKVIAPPDSPAAYSILNDIAGFRHDAAGIAPNSEYMMSVKQTSTDIDCAWKKTDIVLRCGTGIPLLLSTDGGAAWSRVYPPAGYESCEGGSIAVSADGASFIWCPSDSEKAPIVSFDSGITWESCGGLGGNSRITADRTDGKRFYALSGGALYVSTDGGKSFTQQCKISANGEMHTICGFENELWLCGTSLMYSEDGGVSFTELKTISARCIGFGKGKKDGSYVIYAVGAVDNKSGIYFSDDKGESWKRLNDNEHLFAGIADSVAGDPDEYGIFYFCTNGRGIIMGDCSGKE